MADFRSFRLFAGDTEALLSGSAFGALNPLGLCLGETVGLLSGSTLTSPFYTFQLAINLSRMMTSFVEILTGTASEESRLGSANLVVRVTCVEAFGILSEG